MESAIKDIQETITKIDKIIAESKEVIETDKDIQETITKNWYNK